MDKTAFIVRGVPGAGKTTLAERLVGRDRTFEADKYPGIYEPDGTYNAHLQKDAHDWCYEQVRNAMKRNAPQLAIANTFTRREYVKPYIDLIKEFGYQHFIIIVEGNYGSVHNVPMEVRDRMRASFEFMEGDSQESLEGRLEYWVKFAPNRGEVLERLSQFVERLNRRYAPQTKVVAKINRRVVYRELFDAAPDEIFEVFAQELKKIPSGAEIELTAVLKKK